MSIVFKIEVSVEITELPVCALPDVQKCIYYAYISLLLSFILPPNLRDFLSFYIIFYFRFGMIKDERSDRRELV